MGDVSKLLILRNIILADFEAAAGRKMRGRPQREGDFLSILGERELASAATGRGG